jgi:hypothetical protein
MLRNGLAGRWRASAARHPREECAVRVPGQARTRRDLVAALAIVVLVWAVVVGWRAGADVVAPWDSKNQFYAFFRFLASALHQGATPFWNPYHYGGHPAVADPQSLIFAPPFLLWASFDAAPSMFAFDLVVYLHLLAGGLATAAIGWRLGWPVAACVLAGAVFMLGGAASGRMQHTGLILVYGLFPLALLLLQLAMQRRSLVLGLAFAAVAATIVLGRNHAALLLCFVLAAFGLREAMAAERPLQALASRGPLLAVISLATLVLVAAPLLLTLQFAELSNRPFAPLQRAWESSLHPVNLATLFAPNVLGSHTFPPWGPNFKIVPELASVDESFNYLFAGLLPAILLFWVGLAHGQVFRRGIRTIAAVLALAMLYMLGRYTPLYGWAFDIVPGIGLFRRPVDGGFVFVAMFALLSGALLAFFVREGLPPPTPGRLVAAALAAAVLAVFAIAFSARSGKAGAAALQMIVPIVLGLAIAIAMQTVRTARGRGRLAIVLVAVTLVELVWWNGLSRMNAEPARHYRVFETPTGEEARVLDVLERAIETRRLAGERPRVEIAGAGGAFQNLAMVRGIEVINGYNPLRIGVYDRLIAPGETTYLMEQRVFPASFEGYDTPLARALGLSFVLLGKPIEQVAHRQTRGAAELLYAGPPFWLYRLPHPMPRLTFTTRYRVADADGVDSQGRLLDSPTAEAVLLDDDTLPARTIWPSMAARAGTARIVEWHPDRVTIEAESPHGGLLALHDLHYPGWIAEVDGIRVPILRADVLFRAIEVPSGRRRVVFRYAPFSPENLAGILRGLLLE